MIRLNSLLLVLTIVLCSQLELHSQSIFGVWKTVDDETGKEKALVEIYKKDDLVFGKIIEIFDETKRDLPCKFCEGEDKNKPILGLNIIKGMQKDGEYYKDGTIVNPENGKVYDCRLKLINDSNSLQVRGYIAFFYKTQIWERVQ